MSIIVNTSDLAASLVYDLTLDELMNLIDEIDATVGDWDFTRRIRDHFDKQIKKIEAED